MTNITMSWLITTIGYGWHNTIIMSIVIDVMMIVWIRMRNRIATPIRTMTTNR